MSVDVSRLDEVEESGEVRRVGGRSHASSSLTERKISLLFIPLQGPRCFTVTYKINTLIEVLVSKTSQGYYTEKSKRQQ